MRGALDLAHVGFLHPMLNSLKVAGALTDKTLYESGLSNFRINDPNTFIPANSLFRFYELIAKRETGTDLPFAFIENYKMETMGDWSSFILGHDDLYDAIIAACRPELRSFTFERMNLEIQGKLSAISLNFLIESDFIREWIEAQSIHLVVNGLRQASDENWLPNEVHIRGESLFGIQNHWAQKGVKIRTEQEIPKVVFDTDYLFKPLSIDQNIDAASFINADTFPKKVEQIVSSTRNDIKPTIQKISDITDISVRSLQRYLSEDGTDFQTIVDKWKMKLALKAINDPTISIAQICDICRYSHPSHFIRAFRRWTGTSPTEYRSNYSIS